MKGSSWILTCSVEQLGEAGRLRPTHARLVAIGRCHGNEEPLKGARRVAPQRRLERRSERVGVGRLDGSAERGGGD